MAFPAPTGLCTIHWPNRVIMKPKLAVFARPWRPRRPHRRLHRSDSRRAHSAPFTLFSYGETHISAVLAGIINALTPLATLLAALTIFRQQRPNPRIIAGLAIGFAGVLVVVGVWHGLGGGELLGIGACLGAVACYGVAFPYSRRHLAGLADPPVALAMGGPRET
jgi:drug/metabolite transporter (DMT)-like permease